MRAALVLLVLLAVVGLVLTRAEPLAPTATIEGAADVVGPETPIRVVARDRGSGLAHVELRLVTGDGTALVLADADYPRTSWRGSGVTEAILTPRFAADARVPEGPATLEVWATDHSWLSALRGSPRLTRPVTVDRTPPTVEVLTSQHIARLGGSESVVYRVSPDAVESGVRVGDKFFPGTGGLFAEPDLRLALFGVPYDAGDARPQVEVRDAVGNARQTSFDVQVRPRKFAEKTLPITDDFLGKKVPELLAANGLDGGGTLVDGYLRINRDLRRTTEARVRQLCAQSDPQPLWKGAFLRMPNSAPLSGFADRRSYVHDGAVIDQQTHLGFDLASLKQAMVPAANDGIVVFAGPLGIYGTTVILDHGVGLFSLYGHLSEIAVAQGARVARGTPIGKTGETGLAGGDHLHFSIMVRGIHVDPVEWWDDHWIQDHVDLRLGSRPRATPPPATAAPTPPTPAEQPS